MLDWLITGQQGVAKESGVKYLPYNGFVNRPPNNYKDDSFAMVVCFVVELFFSD